MAVMYIRDPVSGEFVPILFSGATGEEIKSAVNEYLERNPVTPGATKEEADQIKENTEGVKRNKDAIDGLTPEAIGALPKNGTAANASKLDGKDAAYYLSARNLLDNSNFKDFIAQVGLDGVHGAVVYAGDRWVGNSLVTTTRINGGVKFNSSDHYAGIRQVVKVRPGVPHTFAVKGTGGAIAVRVYDKNSQAEVGRYNGETFKGIVIAQFTPTEEYVDVWFYPGFADGGGESTLEWAALYEGSYTADNLPPYVPKGYVTELMECQRYFLTCSSVPFFRYSGDDAGTEHFAGGMRFPVPMRIVPSIAAYCDVVNIGPVTPSTITYDSACITAFGCEIASPIPQGIRAYMMFTASADL